MVELTTPNGNGITMLDSLAAEARAYSESAAMNLFQLGRVYTEAKKLILHGGWQEWVRENGGMSERGAQQVMQLYARFGNNPVFSGVDKSKLIKMLSLPAGKEETFAEEHDVENMTSRAVEEAVKRAREEAQAVIGRERAAREQAEARTQELERRPPAIPDDFAETLRKKDAELEALRDEITRQTALSKELLAENKGVFQMQRELAEAEALLQEKQTEYNRLQNELLNAKSAIARGDAESPAADELTPDVFAAAVRQFVGTCARMPHMAKAFSRMTPDDVDAFDCALQTMETLVTGARAALNTICAEVIEHGE